MDNRRKFLMCAGALLGSILLAGTVLTYGVKRILTHDIYKEMERGGTLNGVKEMIVDSSYPEGTYFWGLTNEWNKRVKVSC